MKKHLSGMPTNLRVFKTTDKETFIHFTEKGFYEVRVSKKKEVFVKKVSNNEKKAFTCVESCATKKTE